MYFNLVSNFYTSTVLSFDTISFYQPLSTFFSFQYFVFYTLLLSYFDKEVGKNTNSVIWVHLKNGEITDSDQNIISKKFQITTSIIIFDFQITIIQFKNQMIFLILKSWFLSVFVILGDSGRKSRSFRWKIEWYKDHDRFDLKSLQCRRERVGLWRLYPPLPEPSSLY